MKRVCQYSKCREPLKAKGSHKKRKQFCCNSHRVLAWRERGEAFRKRKLKGVKP